MNEIAESLVVDNELKNMGRANLDLAMYNMEKLDERIEKSNQKKRELLEMLKKSNHFSNSTKTELLNKMVKIKKQSNDDIRVQNVENISTPEIYQEWHVSVQQNKGFAEKNDIDLSSPFFSMFSNVEQVQMANTLTNKFELIELDKYDYLFAVGCGLIAGYVDTMFVGIIKKGKNAKGLQKSVDNIFDKLVEKIGKNQRIAELENQRVKATKPKDKEKIEEMINDLKKGIKGYDKNGTPKMWGKKDGIKILEKNHHVSYDAGTHRNVEGMTLDNHHLRSLAHDFSPIGLVFSVYNQISGTSSFMGNGGKYVSVAAENLNNELDGNIIQRVVQATNNWFFHCLSDVAGSSTSKGRGSGLPVPGWVALQKIQIGNFNLNNRQKNLNVAEVSDWMFKNGYDLRAFTAQTIPVIIYETLLRCYWFCKQYFYYGKKLEDSIPVANNRELARLLLFSSASFTTVDVLHATIKASTGSAFLATFLMTVNIPGLLDLGFRSVQNIRNEVLHRKNIQKLLDTDIKKEFDRIILESPV
ncbi:ATP-binding protein [Enterococcus sp. BSD2780061688st2 D3]|nr:ATP-binding protein [Enterococcus sp. BSD2780061688st2 D3]